MRFSSASVCSLLAAVACASALSIPNTALETINAGGIAVLPNFLSPSVVSRLRSDARNLYYDENAFIVDALAGYGQKAGAKDKASFAQEKDRAVLPALDFRHVTVVNSTALRIALRRRAFRARARLGT